MNDANTHLVDAKALADIVGLPVCSVRRLAREKRIPSYRIGRLLRFDICEVRAALKVAKTGDNPERIN